MIVISPFGIKQKQKLLKQVLPYQTAAAPRASFSFEKVETAPDTALYRGEEGRVVMKTFR